MKIHIVRGEHWHVPGLHISAHRTPDGATRKAVALTNLLLADSDELQQLEANEENWAQRVEQLQDVHGARYTYVVIDEVEQED